MDVRISLSALKTWAVNLATQLEPWDPHREQVPTGLLSLRTPEPLRPLLVRCMLQPQSHWLLTEAHLTVPTEVVFSVTYTQGAADHSRDGGRSFSSVLLKARGKE